MKLSIIILVVLTNSILQAEEYKAVLSAYCSCKKCCSWHYDKNGVPRFDLRPSKKKVIGVTASGSKARSWRTLALPSEFKFGSVVESKMHGEWSVMGIVEDRGGAIISKKSKNGSKSIKVDIYFDSHKDALKFGIRHTTVRIKK